MRPIRPLLPAVLTVALAGGLAACSSGGGGSSVLDLRVGDCLNDAELSGEVRDVPAVDCSDPHDSEVYFEFDAEGTGADEMYPDDDDLSAQADEGCAAAFSEFVGIEAAESRLSFASYSPLLSGWYEPGGREISCVVFDPAGQTTGSLEGIAE